MLVLSRKANETIIIGDAIRITILAVEGEKVKLGIQAPKDIQVARGEIWDAIQEQNLIARQLSEREGGDTSSFDQLRKMLLEDDPEQAAAPDEFKESP